jgi:glycosyltransferase involved in cell wall biosynthesis
VLPFRGRLGYFANAPAFRRLVTAVRPDLVNAHYASGYGTTAALARFRPTLLSVWGSDVYDFPFASPAAGRLLRWNLRRADHLASTSHAMAAQVRRLVGPEAPVAVTPFGVDTQRFRPIAGLRDVGTITIGTIRTLAPTYGIDVLVRAFARLHADDATRESGVASRLRLAIAGEGPDRETLELLVDQLAIREVTRFTGRMPHDEVPAFLNGLDVFVAASRQESFGVAVVEASGCGLPVVVSDAGGLPEVVVDGETGLVVSRDNVDALTAALRRLVLDPALRARLGAAGRSFVEHEYEWGACVDRMIDLYGSVVQGYRSR